MGEPPATRSAPQPASGRKAFLLRMDARLWAELESWAEQELRSVNGQIEYVLRQAVQARRGASRASDTKRGSSMG
jgi:hypothetical protein